MIVSSKKVTSLLKGGGIKDIREFNKWRKTTTDLRNELNRSDATLAVMRFNGEMRAVRTAFNVKCLIQSERGYLCEVGREFTNNGEFVEKFSPWGLSETRKRKEKTHEAVIRGFKQEFGVQVEETDLVHGNAPDELSVHESSVYWRVLSFVCSQYFHFQREEPIYAEQPVKDEGVWIHVKWLQLPDMTAEQQVAWAMAYAKCFEASVRDKQMPRVVQRAPSS